MVWVWDWCTYRRFEGLNGGNGWLVGKRGFGLNIKKAMGPNLPRAWKLDGGLENIGLGIQEVYSLVSQRWHTRNGWLGREGLKWVKK